MALFQAAIFSESKYRSDEPVRTTFKLTNLSQEPMHILKWFTPLEGLWSDCLRVLHNGRRIPYDGPLAKRGIPTEKDYLRLAPGQSIQVQVAVHEAYKVSEPGTYNVSAETEIQAVAVPEMKMLTSAKAGRREAVAALFKKGLRQPIREAATNFEVEAGDTATMTAGERVRQRQFKAFAAAGAEFKAVAGKAREPVYNGGTPAKQKAAREAHFAGYKLNQAALKALANDARYSEWFGTYNQTRFQSVKDHYSRIGGDMEQKVFTYDLSKKGCQAGTFAYTYKGSSTVWLCDQFWAAPASGTDSKAGTIVHEHSHASASTDDITYGQPNARQLAIDDPDKAIRNADSHEYYAKG